MTSRIEGDAHQDLLREKGGTGFPTLMFLDEEGEVLAKQSDRTVQAFHRSVSALNTLAELEGKEDRDAEEEVRYFLAMVDLGKIDYEEAVEMRKKLPPPPAELTEEVAERMIALEISHRLSTVRNAEQAAEVGAVFADMAKEGRVPKGKGFTPARFWLAVSEHAKAEKDADLFEKAFEGVKKALGEGDQFQRLYDQMAEALQEMRGGG